MAVYIIKFPQDEPLENVQTMLGIMQNGLPDGDQVLAVPMHWDFSEYSVKELVRLKENMNKVIDEVIRAKNFARGLDAIKE